KLLAPALHAKYVTPEASACLDHHQTSSKQSAGRVESPSVPALFSPLTSGGYNAHAWSDLPLKPPYSQQEATLRLTTGQPLYVSTASLASASNKSIDLSSDRVYERHIGL